MPSPCHFENLIRHLARGAIGIQANKAGYAPHPLSLVRGVTTGPLREPFARLVRGEGRDLLEPDRLRAPSARSDEQARCRTSSWTPASNIASVRATMRRSSSSAWQLEAEDQRRVPRVGRPKPVLFRRERAAGRRELESADDPAPVVRMDAGGSLGVAVGKERVRALRTLGVVEGFPAVPLARRRRRWKVELGERRAQVEASPADDDRASSPARGPRRSRRGPAPRTRRRRLRGRAPRCRRAGWPVGLVGQDRQAAVDLHRVGGDELGRNAGRRALRRPPSCPKRSARTSRARSSAEGARGGVRALAHRLRRRRGTRGRFHARRSSSTARRASSVRDDREQASACALGSSGASRSRAPATDGAQPRLALGIVCGDRVHAGAGGPGEGGDEARAVDPARAVDRALGRRPAPRPRTLPVRTVRRIVEEEEVVPSAPVARARGRPPGARHLADALGIEQRDVGRVSTGGSYGRILVPEVDDPTDAVVGDALRPDADRSEMSSDRTITPKRVSPPSSSGKPPRSRMLQQPSQRRVRSGRNCGELGATQRRRSRAFDADVDQVTGGR